MEMDKVKDSHVKDIKNCPTKNETASHIDCIKVGISEAGSIDDRVILVPPIEKSTSPKKKKNLKMVGNEALEREISKNKPKDQSKINKKGNWTQSEDLILMKWVV